MIKPLGDHLLIKKHPDNWLTKNGLIMAYKERSTTGEVLAVGKGRTTKKGTTIPTECKVGDIVAFKKYAGHWYVDPSNDDIMILSESEVIANLS